MRKERRESRHICTKMSTKRKKTVRGKEFQLVLNTATAMVTFLLRIISDSPTKRHKSNEWIKIPAPNTGCLQDSLQI